MFTRLDTIRSAENNEWSGNKSRLNVLRCVMAIEFRVQGKDSAKVAQELVAKLKAKFQVEAVVHTPPGDLPGGNVEKVDLTEVALRVVNMAIISFHLYNVVLEH